MNFIGALNVLFTTYAEHELKNSALITRELENLVKTEVDAVQFAQFKYLLELGGINFVYEMYMGHNVHDNLLPKLEYLISLFDESEISPQVYSYFLFCVLQALKIKTERVHWVNPLTNNLEEDTVGAAPTFGEGLYTEEISGFDIISNVIKRLRQSRKYITIPQGIIGVEDKVLSDDRKVEFVSIPDTCVQLTHGMLEGCSNMKSVVMSSKVTAIPQNFAKGCRNLKLVVAQGVKEIRSKAFEDTSISNLDYIGPNTLQLIATEAFRDCYNLTKIDVTNVTDVHPLAFMNCRNIKDVAISLSPTMVTNNQKFHSLFDTNRTEFQKYTELQSVQLTITDGIIPESFFEDCVNVKSITIVGEVNEIGAKAFKNCTLLETLNMNFVGTKLEDEVFFGCHSLVVAPEFTNVSVIANSVFRQCHSLQVLQFNEITTLGTSVCRDCTSLVEFNLNKLGVKSLPEFTFAGCEALTTYNFLTKVKRLETYSLAKNIFSDGFELPKNIVEVESNAFDSCSFEGVLTIPKGCKFDIAAFSNISKISSVIYDNLAIKNLQDEQILPHMVFEDGLEDFNRNFTQLVNIKLNTTDIYDEAFMGWQNIQKVIIEGDNVVIPSSCFENCVNLKSVQLNSKSFEIGNRAFANCRSLIRLRSKQEVIQFATEEVVDLSVASKVEFGAFTKCTSVRQICFAVDKARVEQKVKVYEVFEQSQAEMANNYMNLDTVIINLKDGVVPEYFFDGCQNLANIQILGEVDELSDGFFRNCTKLRNLEMQYVGSVIPKECFKNCVSLNRITDFAYVDRIEDEAFYGCESLEYIKVDCEVTSLGRSSFENCKELKKLDIGFTGDILPEKCFLNCSNMLDFKFLNTITKIESYALSNVLFESGNNVPPNLKHIAPYAFAESYFENILMIPNTESISPLSFIHTSGFNKIDFSNLTLQDINKNDLQPYELFTNTLMDYLNTYTKVDTVRIRTNNICDNAFKDWSTIRHAIIYDTTKKLPQSCFENCVSLEKVKLPYYDIELGKNVFANCSSLTDVSYTDFTIMDNTITSVPLGTYNNCVKLQHVSVSIDRAVLNSGMKLYSFFEDDLITFNTKYKGLQSVTVRSKVKEIPESFFEGCLNLEKIVILDEIDELHKRAFADCGNLLSLKLKYNGTVIPEACFLRCDRLPNITNLKSVTTIEESAFEGCISITAIQFATPITSLGVKAFNRCLNLERINMYYIGEFLPKLAFGSCEGLLETPRFLKLVFADNSAFEGCLNLDCVYINAVAGVRFVNLFASSKRINKIHFASTHIPDHFFQGLRNIEDIIFDKKIKSIGNSAFEGVKGIQTITNISEVESIGDYAFANSDIKHIKISPKTKFMGVGIFAACESLEVIEMPVRYAYAGSLFDSLYDSSTKQVVHTNHFINKEYYIPFALKHIIINDGKLSNGVFSGMRVDITVDCPMKEIADYAFFECNTVTFTQPETINIVGHAALCNSSFDTMVIENAKSIGDYAFAGSVGNLIQFGAKLTRISPTSLADSNIGAFNIIDNANYYFENEMLVDIAQAMIVHVNNVVGEITIPDKVLTIESETFVGCNELTKVDTNKVKRINSNAFRNCENLQEVVMQQNVVSYQESIFTGCTSLTNLHLPFLGADKMNPQNIDYLFDQIYEDTYLNYVRIFGGLLSPNAFSVINKIGTLDLEKLPIKVFEAGTLKDLYIESFTLPNSVQLIEEFTFDNTIINQFNILENKAVAQKDFCLYTQNKLIYCYRDVVDSITIPKNMVGVETNAFQVCHTIGSLEIMNNNLEFNNAFDNLGSLRSLNCGQLKDNIADIFKSCVSTITMVTYKDQRIKESFYKDMYNINEMNLPFVDELKFISMVDPKKIALYPKNPTSILKLNLGSELTTIDPLFLKNVGINNINVENNKNFKTVRNMLIDVTIDTIVYVARDIEEVLTIDFDVQKIGKGAFEKCERLKSINTGNVKLIGDNAFAQCKALKNVTITNNCEYIGKHILAKCSSLDNVFVPFIGSNLTDLDKINYLFEIVTKENPIKTLTVTNQEVIDGTFAFAKNIDKIMLGSKTNRILKGSFNNCVDVKEVHIPANVGFVEDYSFSNCKSKLTVHLVSKLQGQQYSKDWRKTGPGKLMPSVKVTYAK